MSDKHLQMLLGNLRAKVYNSISLRTGRNSFCCTFRWWKLFDLFIFLQKLNIKLPLGIYDAQEGYQYVNRVMNPDDK